MLRWTVIFLIVAIIAAIFGFGGIAAGGWGSYQYHLQLPEFKRGFLLDNINLLLFDVFSSIM